MKKHTKKQPTHPHLLQAQQALALLYAKAVGRPGTGSYPASSPDLTTHCLCSNFTLAEINKEFSFKYFFVRGVKEAKSKS